MVARDLMPRAALVPRVIAITDDGALGVDGHRPLPLEAKPAERQLVRKAKLVGPLQEPRPEVAVYFDARRDDLV